MTTGEPIIAGCDEDEILEIASTATSIVETSCPTQSQWRSYTGALALPSASVAPLSVFKLITSTTYYPFVQSLANSYT